MSSNEASAAVLSWVVSETGESFTDYNDYVQRLVELRQPKTDMVLTAFGSIAQPDPKSEEEPANLDKEIVEIDISPDEALRRLAGVEFHGVGVDSAERVRRLKAEVDTLLAQADDDGFGADLVAELRRMRVGLRHLTGIPTDPAFDRVESPTDAAPSVLHLHERVLKLEEMLQASTLSHAESVLEELKNHVALLSETRLEQIAAKSKQVLAELQLLSQEASENLNKRAFDDLRAAAARWDDASNALPHVVERLIAIKGLHEHGSNILNRISTAEQVVQMSSQKLLQCESAVANIERTLSDNLRVMEQNCTALCERLDLLEQNKK